MNEKIVSQIDVFSQFDTMFLLCSSKMGKKDKNRENGCEKSEDTRGRGVENVFEVEYLTLLPQRVFVFFLSLLRP